jgi:hypothetical protein
MGYSALRRSLIALAGYARGRGARSINLPPHRMPCRPHELEAATLPAMHGHRIAIDKRLVRICEGKCLSFWLIAFNPIIKPVQTVV